jgi:hypothetical protein
MPTAILADIRKSRGINVSLEDATCGFVPPTACSRRHMLEEDQWLAGDDQLAQTSRLGRNHQLYE